ncbi:MFS general substrate transporter [Mycena rebaudengoi]|nr:MFS general substrate transporter [Mycena rebaudengoi]
MEHDDTKGDANDIERSSGGSQVNREGDYHQSQMGPKPTRKHFFSPLDSGYADAVHRDAETVEFTEAEERAVKRKIDVVVLPLIVCRYDRTNIGNAHTLKPFNEHFVRTASSSLHCPPSTNNDKWTLALSIFYVGYFLQRHIGANRFFFLSLLFWGIASLSVVYAKGYAGLLVLRVLMGIGEAGYYAGMIYYLSFWYKKYEPDTSSPMRISLCMTGTLPGAIGVLVFLAFGLVRAKTSLLDGWIEAIPTIIMAFMILFFLPSFPFSATFLTPRERAIAQARLNRDHKPQSHGGMTGWDGFKVIIADPERVALYAHLCQLCVSLLPFLPAHVRWLTRIYFVVNVGVATISYFLPTLIKDLGFTAINAQGLTVAPYVVGWFMVFFQAVHSDRTRDRGYHIMLGYASFYYFCLARSSSPRRRSWGTLSWPRACRRASAQAYFALFLVVGGNYSLFPLVMSWAANTFSPTSKRGVGTAFIVSISNCVSIASPQIYFDPEDNFRKGCVALSFLAAFTLRTRLAMLNKRNAKILAELDEVERKKLDETSEIWDSDPRYVFMT